MRQLQTQQRLDVFDLIPGFGRNSSLGSKFLNLFLYLLSLSVFSSAQQPTPGFSYVDVKPQVSANGITEGFTLLSPTTTRISFVNILPEHRHLTNQILLNGSGVAAGDIDADGQTDLFFCNLEGHSSLYRNLGGWGFTNVTASLAGALTKWSITGAAFVDVDGDAALDLAINSFGDGTHIFLNDGIGNFSKTQQILNPGKSGTSMAWADINGDNQLDVYIANYRLNALMDLPNARATFRTVNGIRELESLDGRSLTEPDLTNRFSVTPAGVIEEHGEVDVLYLNLGKGEFRATSWTDGTFLNSEGQTLTSPPRDWALAAMFRDINGDSLPDLYVCNDFHSPDRFWINQGKGRFKLLSNTAQSKSSIFSMSIDFADFDRDGHDDFVIMEMLPSEHTLRMRTIMDRITNPAGASSSLHQLQHNQNMLFLNRGNTTFAEVANHAGISATDWSWGCAFLDVDLDGWEDLLIANGMERAARDIDVADRIKTMRATRKLSDTEVFQARRQFPRQATPNFAFKNIPTTGRFEDYSSPWNFNFRGVSQGLALADLDNDGDLDVIINNLNAPPSLYRNEAQQSRIGIRLLSGSKNSRGIGARIEFLCPGFPTQTQEMIAGGRYLSGDDPIRTFACSTNTRSLVRIRWPSGQSQSFSNLIPNRVYTLIEDIQFSSSSPMDSKREVNEPSIHTSPWFKAFFIQIDSEPESPLPDFESQPLLPRFHPSARLSVAWSDPSERGSDHVRWTSHQGSSVPLFSISGSELLTARPKSNVKPLATLPPVACILSLGHRPNSYSTWISLSQVEVKTGSFKELNHPANLKFDFNTDETNSTPNSTAPPPRRVLGNVAFPKFDNSITNHITLFPGGTLCATDIHGDGELEVFHAGGLLPGRYPITAQSAIFSSQNGVFSRQVLSPHIVGTNGPIRGATFAHLDDDSVPELILAREWGAVEIFHTRSNALSRWDPRLALDHGFSKAHLPTNATLKLSDLTGWWTGIVTGDFDEDGRTDILAGNWGSNTRYQSLRHSALHLFHGDLDTDGTDELVESHFDPLLKKLVPDRQLEILTKHLLFLRGKFSSNRGFANASLPDVLGINQSKMRQSSVTWLESTLFLNRSDYFLARPLPWKAQLSPITGAAASDFDGDGHLDVLLAQNFFDNQPEFPRYDAGRGLILKGNGAGEFTLHFQGQSGIDLTGQQGTVSTGDVDHDGRIDTLISQLNGPTQFLKNTQSLPGIHIQLLRAESDKRPALGAVVRWKTPARLGRLVELQAGSGFNTQNSSTLLLHPPHDVQQLWIRWPNGKSQFVPISLSAHESVFYQP